MGLSWCGGVSRVSVPASPLLRRPVGRKYEVDLYPDFGVQVLVAVRRQQLFGVVPGITHLVRVGAPEFGGAILEQFVLLQVDQILHEFSRLLGGREWAVHGVCERVVIVVVLDDVHRAFLVGLVVLLSPSHLCFEGGTDGYSRLAPGLPPDRHRRKMGRAELTLPPPSKQVGAVERRDPPPPTDQERTMTVEQLRDVLNQAIENGCGDREIRFAYQSNYPLQDLLEGVWYDEDDEDDQEESESNVFYLVSGGQDTNHPYAPRVAFEECTDVL